MQEQSYHIVTCLLLFEIGVALLVLRSRNQVSFFLESTNFLSGNCLMALITCETKCTHHCFISLQNKNQLRKTGTSNSIIEGG